MITSGVHMDTGRRGQGFEALTGAALHGVEEPESAGLRQAAVIGGSARHTGIIGTVTALSASGFATGGILGPMVELCVFGCATIDFSGFEDSSDNIRQKCHGEDYKHPAHQVGSAPDEEPDGDENSYHQQDDFA